MKFMGFKRGVQQQISDMITGNAPLFEVDLDKDKLWELYLASFPKGTNPIFRERTEHDCSCCRQFIKSVGNVVKIVDNELISIWDIDTDCTTYGPVAKAMSKFVKSHAINNKLLLEANAIGTDSNKELTETTVYNWEHLYFYFPDAYVNKTNRSIADVKGEFRTTRDVFKRSLEEISQDSVETVLELIAQNSLYRGEEWKSVLNSFLTYKKTYDLLATNARDNYTWLAVSEAGIAISRIRNHSIGTLLTNLSEGMDLETAVRKYEVIVAPTNYKRPKAIFTKQMLEDAKNKIQELGYMDSLPRRHANVDDITVNNILFVNRDQAKDIGGLDIFGEMAKEVAINPRKFSSVQEVSMDKFVSDILPTAKEIEVLVENKHRNNFVSLIAPVNKDAKSMLKWNNNFGWAYAGNIADSDMKQNVKNAGGDVEGVLRFSIQWSDKTYDGCDLDAHCVEPRGNHIYFGDKRNTRTTGKLDVDIVNPNRTQAAVENITWTDISKMEEGTYTFSIHAFSGRCNHGVKAEIEFNGEIYDFEIPRMAPGERMVIARVIYTKANGFTLESRLNPKESISSKEIWSVNTGNFAPVNVVMHSPNYWDEQQGIGNKHVFFMLKDCLNPETVNGFYNEFLDNALTPHRKVFEALGSKMSVEPSASQLSGLGFSTTKPAEVLVRVTGATKRILKIKI